MANTYGLIEALRPADTNEAELYEVGVGESIVGTLYVCNQDSAVRDYSVALTATSGAASGAEWITYEGEIQAKLTHKIIIPATAGNTIRVQASVADKISFVLTGLKIT
jgi:hypothetical protein